MTKIVRTALAAAALVAGALGLSGTAAAEPPDLCATVDADGMCQFHASGPFSDIDLVFPSDYPEQQKVTDYLNGVVDQYNEDSDLGLPTSPHALDVTGTRYHSADTESVVLSGYQNVGGAHPSTWYKAFTVDTTTQQPETFESVFRPGATEALLPLVQRSLSEQFGQPVEIPTDTGLDPANYQNFALTDDAVVFFFDNRALIPATPATEVTVPRSAITGVLNGQR